MLKSTQNTELIYQEIIKAARVRFGNRQKQYKLLKVSSIAFFEYDQWWFKIINLDQNLENTYSVVDAVPGILDTGIDFELVNKVNLWWTKVNAIV